MLAKSLTLLAVVAAVSAAVADRRANVDTDAGYKPFEGVDPNSLSCDPKGEEFLLLPHREDCNKFYMCNHGKEVLFTCSDPRLIFDFASQSCDWPWSGTCTLRTPEAGSEEEGSDEEGSGFNEGDEIIHDFEEANAVAQPEVHFNNILKCSSAEDASRSVPYKGDCQRYWRCLNGVPQTVYCSDGLFFNAVTQQCDFEGNAKCVVDVNDELQGEYMIFE